jgi:signal transduction histidine kinase
VNDTPQSPEWDLGWRHPVRLYLPYALLAFCLGVTELVQRPPTRGLILDLALCILASGWILWMTTLHPAWLNRPRLMGLFVAVLVLILAALITRDAWFGFFLVVGYGYPLRVLPWPWRLAGVASMAVLAAIAQTENQLSHGVGGVAVFFSVVSLNALSMCSLAWYIRVRSIESDNRRLAVEELSETNRRLEATLVENAGLHKQLVVQAREAGVLDERHRMAREIHDTLAQGLAGIVTQLQAAEQAADDPAGWRRHFAAATTLARESLTEARRSVDALRPEPLETGKLADALADVASRWSSLHGVPVTVTTTGIARWTHPEADFVLLRAAQEALANVAKHARASRVGLTLSYMDNEVALDVRDDGAGFDPSGAGDDRDRRGFGLVAMRQRVEGLSGTLQVESEPGSGTAISACVPFFPARASA